MLFHHIFLDFIFVFLFFLFLCQRKLRKSFFQKQNISFRGEKYRMKHSSYTKKKKKEKKKEDKS